MKQGLIPAECTRFDVANAYAAYGDWWNEDGLTRRDQYHHTSISVQLSRLGYFCPGDYLESYASKEIYLALVKKYHPDRYEDECKKVFHEEE